MKWFLLAVLLAPVSFISFNATAKPLVRVMANDNSPFNDTVKKVRADDEGLVVLFSKAIGSFYLRKDNANFDDYKKALEGSLANKKPLSVTVDSDLNILEVK